MQREQHLLLNESSVVAMECTPDRDLLLIQIPVAKMKRSIDEHNWSIIGKPQGSPSNRPIPYKG